MNTTVTAAALALCAGLSLAAVTNGGFEAGTGPDADNWNEIEVAGGSMGAAALADRTTSNVRTGDYAMMLSVTGAADFGPVAEIQQQTAVGSVTAGAEYDFSFWAMGTPGPGSVAFFEVLFFDGDGSDGGGPQGSSGLQTFALNGAYTEFGVSGLVAPASADSVLIQIRLVTGAFDGAAGEAFIDDVSFNLVPAPGAIALVGMGGLLAARRRR